MAAIRPLVPGRPGRGHDPTAGLTDMQWYMYHQRNVAYFGAFSTADDDRAALVTMLKVMFKAAPQFAGGMTVDDDMLGRLIEVETVPDFSGFPDVWLDDGYEVFSDPGLPMVRMRVGRLDRGPDEKGRRSFVLVRVAHPFAEGLDSALLSRSESSSHDAVPPAAPVAPATAVGARVLAGLAAVMHLLVSRLWTPHPGRLRVATRSYPRGLFSNLARSLGVTQRALFIAITAHVIAGAALPRTKRRLTSTYSTLRPGGGARRDSFIRMRMLFASFANHADFASFAQAVDATIGNEDRESGFNAEMNAAAIGFHRWLAGVMPFLYGPRVFAFMPYDFVFALLPPHHLGGDLTRGLIEPVYAGATVAGVNGCVVVPGRKQVVLEFALEESLIPNVARLDTLLKALAPAVENAPTTGSYEMRRVGHD